MSARKAKPAPDAAIIKSLPLDAKAVARLQKQAEADHELYELITPESIDNGDDYLWVDNLLTGITGKIDAAVAMRKSVTGPLYGVIKTVESWFRPLLSELEFAQGQCKRAMGAFKLREAEAESQAHELAAQAADVGDSDTLVEALTAATEIAAEAKPEGVQSSTTFKWSVDRVLEDLLPDEILLDGVKVQLWIPDLAYFDRVARTTNGADTPPVIPGVVWKRIAQIGASHK